MKFYNININSKLPNLSFLEIKNLLNLKPDHHHKIVNNEEIFNNF